MISLDFVRYQDCYSLLGGVSGFNRCMDTLQGNDPSCPYVFYHWYWDSNSLHIIPLH